MPDHAPQSSPKPSPRVTDPRPQGRVRLLLDVSVFQLKLGMDGTRDLLLIPVSLGAALLGLLFGGNEPQRYFDKLLELGRRSDRFINLFKQHVDDPQPNSDSMLEPFKQRVLERAHDSPLTARVSDVLDQLTDTPPVSRPASHPDTPDTPNPSPTASDDQKLDQ